MGAAGTSGWELRSGKSTVDGKERVGREMAQIKWETEEVRENVATLCDILDQ